MTKVLVDTLFMAAALLSAGIIFQSAKAFLRLFRDIRAEMARGMPTRTLWVTTSTTSAPAPIAAIYRPEFGTGLVNNQAGALKTGGIKTGRRRVALRAAA